MQIEVEDEVGCCLQEEKLTLLTYDPEAWRTMARNGNF